MTLLKGGGCPGCGSANTREQSSGLGGRWKVICRRCGYRFAECDGERAGIAPDPDEKE